jgi:hypothetical protein
LQLSAVAGPRICRSLCSRLCAYAGPAAKQPAKPNFRSASPRLAVPHAQPVAHAGLRENMRGRFRPGFDLLPELAHIDPQILHVA